MDRDEVTLALDAIISGDGVRRGRHPLGQQTVSFTERLQRHGFLEGVVRDFEPAEGRRIPAFVVDGDDAVFGYIFVEKFTDTKSRRLFGSEERNEKGDWAITLGISSRRTVYACRERSVSYDEDRPE